MQRWRPLLLALVIAALSMAAPSLPPACAQEAGESAPRGAMGLLIRNPETARGEPPYAIADQFGRVQRLVEPSPGMSLDRFIGERVRIKHDTGHTLLASQLELPTGVTSQRERQSEPRVELRDVSPAQFVPPRRAREIDPPRSFGVIPTQATEDGGEAIDLDRVLANEKATESLPEPAKRGSLDPIPADNYYPEAHSHEGSSEVIDMGIVDEGYGHGYSDEGYVGDGPACDCAKCRAKSRRFSSPRRERLLNGGGALSLGSCATCGQPEGSCGPTCNPASRRGVYARADYLLWWFDGMNTPPLVTTNDLGNAPILGDPGTRVVYQGELLDDARSGARFTLGAWLDDQRDLAIEADWMFFESQADAFAYNDPTGAAVIGRPFYNVAPIDAQDNLLGPAEDVQIIAFNGQAGGFLNVQARSEFQSAGIRLRTGVCCRDLCGSPQMCGCSECVGGGLLSRRGPSSGISRIDFIVGYRYLSLEEQISFNESVSFISPATGTVNVSEHFNTTNDFHGVDLGYVYDLQSRRWGLELTTKIALGGTRQRVDINGSNSVGAGTALVTTPGGLLAQSSNIGSYSRDRFSAVPELGARLSYRVTPQLSLSTGYSLIYWANVVRPGDVMDYSVDGRLASGALTTPTANSHPRFDWDETSLWAHGLNFGLDYNY
jgi:hypothetical protein